MVPQANSRFVPNQDAHSQKENPTIVVWTWHPGMLSFLHDSRSHWRHGGFLQKPGLEVTERIYSDLFCAHVSSCAFAGVTTEEHEGPLLFVITYFTYVYIEYIFDFPNLY